MFNAPLYTLTSIELEHESPLRWVLGTHVWKPSVKISNDPLMERSL